MGLGEVIKAWDSGTQLAFFITGLAMLFLTTLLVIGALLKTVRVLFRGYPPEATPVQKPQTCYNENNLRGVCLKMGGCKTVDECNNTVANNGKVEVSNG